MDTSRILAACGALAFALQLAPAAADSGPWYVGAGFGATTYGVPSSITFNFAPPVSSSSDQIQITNKDSATAYRFDGGYQFDKHFALEGLYADFGSVTSNYTGKSPAFSRTGSMRVKAWGLEGVGRLPLSGGFGLFARVGLVHYTNDHDIAEIEIFPSSVPVFTLTAGSTSGTTGVVGAGADYDFTGNLSLRAALDYFRGKNGSISSYMPGVHLLSLEAIFRFN